MTKTLIGLDYLGVPCVKIAKGNIDPVTTPDSQVSAWFYNSKWSKDINVEVTMTEPFYFADTYVTGGYVRYSAGFDYYFLSNAHFGSLEYNYPLFDLKAVNYSTGRFQQAKTIFSTSGYGDRGGRWRSGGAYEGGWFGGFSNPNSPVSYPYTARLQGRASPLDGAPGDVPSVVVWRLPGDASAIKNGTPLAPVPGQASVLINSAACRVAKPGYNVYTATSTQLAFDSSKRPPKVVAAADIVVPAGVSAYDIGVVAPAGSVPDVYFYTGSVLYFPTNPTEFEKGAEYWLSGQYLYFNNPNGACRARFIIIAGSGAPPTVGDNDVLRQINVAGENVVQFLRPGAGPNPNFTDIILDSRWPSLQMLAEGYIPVGAGAQQHAVPINTSGLFPIVKYVTLHGAGTGGPGNIESWNFAVRPPITSRIGLYRTGWQNILDAGDSTYCRLTATEARFYTFQGFPVRQFYADLEAFDRNQPSYEYDPSPIIGIRYYVFGIPT